MQSLKDHRTNRDAKRPRLSVAPMMEWTDRHCRYFHRQITKQTLLYTEMVPSGTILRGDRVKFLGYSPEELPVTLQLGGDDAVALRDCAQIAESMGYAEVNLNVGCPSERVQSGSFGACLMARPDHVARIVEAMRTAVKIPVTVKHRIGIDGREKYEDLRDFVAALIDAGCVRFVVHARIAILGGLTPAQNRSVPPLRYHDVYKLKSDFPDAVIEINGGIKTLDEAEAHLQHVDGVMIGRAAYENPYILAQADERIFGNGRPGPSRAQILDEMMPYIVDREAQGTRARSVIRHMLGLFHGQPGARRFRRRLSESMHNAHFTTADFRQIADEVLTAAAREAVSLP